jgi:hypothetical protein
VLRQKVLCIHSAKVSLNRIADSSVPVQQTDSPEQTVQKSVQREQQNSYSDGYG